MTKAMKNMKDMKMGKVLTYVTKEDAFGNSDYVITPIPAYRTPEMEFAHLGLMGKIESYEVTDEMPLAIAIAFALQKLQALGGNEVRFIKW